MRRWIFASVLLLGACAPAAPANWARGGVFLDVPRARWVVGTSVVELYPDGRVMLNDEQQMTVDRAGRVFDTSNDPIGLLEPDGRLLGPGDKPLGNVGILHAARADEVNAWLSVLPSGEVVRYGDESERASLGVWIGCNQNWSAHQTCTLVSHLLAPRILNATRYYPSSMYGPGSPFYGSGMYPGGGFMMPPFR